MISLLEFHNLFWDEYGVRKSQIEFFMQSDAYIPEQIAFRKIKVNGGGKIITSNHKRKGGGDETKRIKS